MTCEVCRVNPAVLCCNCKIPPAFLCDNRCFGDHQGKNPIIPHSNMPIAALNQDPDEYMRKFINLKQGTTELQRNIERLAQFEQELTTSVDRAIYSLNQYKESWSQWLRTEKEQLATSIDQAIQEAQSSLAQNIPPISDLAEALLSLPAEQLQLVSYSIKIPDFQVISTNWVFYVNNLTNIFSLLILQRNPTALGENIKYIIDTVVCAICTFPIGKESNVILGCNHSFHKECISHQGETHIDTVVKTPILCWKCHTPIDGNILQQLMKPQVFNKYITKVIEAQNKKVYCPNCNTEHLEDATRLLQQAPVWCQNCGFQFCVLCQAQWRGTHDIKRCQFDEMQSQIRVLGQAMGHNDVISQCPTCKVPFLKNNQREYGMCSTPNCPYWNFCCSSLRRPCLSHSTHWHRPDCKHWVAGDISAEPIKENCPECVRLGRRCNPPTQLKVPRRFDFDEY